MNTYNVSDVFAVLKNNQVTITINENDFCENKQYPCESDLFNMIENPLTYKKTNIHHSKDTTKDTTKHCSNNIEQSKPDKNGSMHVSYKEFLKEKIAFLKINNPSQTGKDRMKQVIDEWNIMKQQKLI